MAGQNQFYFVDYCTVQSKWVVGLVVNDQVQTSEGIFPMDQRALQQFRSMTTVKSSFPYISLDLAAYLPLFDHLISNPESAGTPELATQYYSGFFHSLTLRYCSESAWIQIVLRLATAWAQYSVTSGDFQTEAQTYSLRGSILRSWPEILYGLNRVLTPDQVQTWNEIGGVEAFLQLLSVSMPLPLLLGYPIISSTDHDYRTMLKDLQKQVYLRLGELSEAEIDTVNINEYLESFDRLNQTTKAGPPEAPWIAFAGTGLRLVKSDRMTTQSKGLFILTQLLSDNKHQTRLAQFLHDNKCIPLFLNGSSNIQLLKGSVQIIRIIATHVDVGDQCISQLLYMRHLFQVKEDLELLDELVAAALSNPNSLSRVNELLQAPVEDLAQLELKLSILKVCAAARYVSLEFLVWFVSQLQPEWKEQATTSLIAILKRDPELQKGLLKAPRLEFLVILDELIASEPNLQNHHPLSEWAKLQLPRARELDVNRLLSIYARSFNGCFDLDTISEISQLLPPSTYANELLKFLALVAELRAEGQEKLKLQILEKLVVDLLSWPINEIGYASFSKLTRGLSWHYLRLGFLKIYLTNSDQVFQEKAQRFLMMLFWFNPRTDSSHKSSSRFAKIINELLTNPRKTAQLLISCFQGKKSERVSHNSTVTVMYKDQCIQRKFRNSLSIGELRGKLEKEFHIPRHQFKLALPSGDLSPNQDHQLLRKVFPRRFEVREEREDELLDLEQVLSEHRYLKSTLINAASDPEVFTEAWELITRIFVARDTRSVSELPLQSIADKAYALQLYLRHPNRYSIPTSSFQPKCYTLSDPLFALYSGLCLDVLRLTQAKPSCESQICWAFSLVAFPELAEKQPNYLRTLQTLKDQTNPISNYPPHLNNAISQVLRSILILESKNVVEGLIELGLKHVRFPQVENLIALEEHAEKALADDNRYEMFWKLLELCSIAQDYPLLRKLEEKCLTGRDISLLKPSYALNGAMSVLANLKVPIRNRQQFWQELLGTSLSKFTVRNMRILVSDSVKIALLWLANTAESGNLSNEFSMLQGLQSNPQLQQHKHVWKFLNYAKIKSGRTISPTALKNLENTCYFSVIIQTLYNLTWFRNQVMTCEFDNQVAANLKELFQEMQTTDKYSAKPRKLFESLRGYNGQPLDPLEQQDCEEFRNAFYEALPPQLLANNLIGEWQYLTRCSEGHVTTRQESFTSIHLDIRGLKHIEESLAALAKPEVLVGRNQYDCEVCGRKVDATRTPKLLRVPAGVFLVLKRFEYDYENNEKVKVGSELVFPEHLSLGALTPQRDLYRLSSIIVHRGDALGGHYIAYVNTPAGWYELDDTRREHREWEFVGRVAYGSMAGDCAYVLVYTDPRADCEEAQVAIPQTVAEKNLLAYHKRFFFMSTYPEFIANLIDSHVEIPTEFLLNHYFMVVLRIVNNLNKNFIRIHEEILRRMSLKEGGSLLQVFLDKGHFEPFLKNCPEHIVRRVVVHLANSLSGSVSVSMVNSFYESSCQFDLNNNPHLADCLELITILATRVEIGTDDILTKLLTFVHEHHLQFAQVFARSLDYNPAIELSFHSVYKLLCTVLSNAALPYNIVQYFQQEKTLHSLAYSIKNTREAKSFAELLRRLTESGIVSGEVVDKMLSELYPQFGESRLYIYYVLHYTYKQSTDLCSTILNLLNERKCSPETCIHFIKAIPELFRGRNGQCIEASIIEPVLNYLRTVPIPHLDPQELQTLRNTFKFAKTAVYPEQQNSLIGYQVVHIEADLKADIRVTNELASTPLVYAESPGRWIDKEDRSIYFLLPSS